MVRLEMKTDGHNKFWTIEQDDCEISITYGAIGATPRPTHKAYDSAEKAATFMEKEIKAKKKKGYSEVGEDSKEPAAKKSKTDDGDKATTRLENCGDGHNKFWQITVSGCSTVVEYGAIGSTPKQSEKSHDSVAAAQKFKTSMLGKKKKEGYSEVGGASSIGGATGGGEPQLFIYGEPCTGLELEKRRDDWDGPDGEDDLCSGDHMHSKMSDAPGTAKTIADMLCEAMPKLEDTQMVMSSESSDGGEVIVIANPGDDAKVACLKALAVKEDNFAAASKAATISEKKWSDHCRLGFNRKTDDDFDPDEEFDEDMQEERGQFEAVLKGTTIMKDKLVKGFEFNFTDSFAVAPVIFGGYASDGNIVGILSSRVWT